MPQSGEIITLHHENTGGLELEFIKKMTVIQHPYTSESSTHPGQVALETLIWNNPEPEKRELKVQYVVVGGMNINAVEVHPVLAMLTNHADTIIGISHPDAPQSEIEPRDSPFNDKLSFANSGFTILRAIEQLILDKELDINQPISLVGYSTGCAVLTETLAQHLKEVESEYPSSKRFLTNLALFSPGGMLDIGEKEITQGAIDTNKEYWNEFMQEQLKRVRSYIKHPKQFIEDLADNMDAGNIFEEIRYAYHLAQELAEFTKNTNSWPKMKEWDAVKNSSIFFQLIDKGIRLQKTQFFDALHAHFHRSWIVQPGMPNMSPETPAYSRSRENVGYDVTRKAREIIRDTPIVMWLGKKDTAIQAVKFLKDEDLSALRNIESVSTRDETENELILQRARESYANNTENMHIILTPNGNHMTPRADASMLEIYLLRYLYPDLIKPKTIFVGSNDSSV